MLHPFIDVSKLTDDELISRMSKCQQILYAEMGMGHQSMMDSARMMLESYQMEWDNRMALKRNAEDLEKNPNGTIEIGTIEDISNLKPTGDE